MSSCGCRPTINCGCSSRSPIWPCSWNPTNPYGATPCRPARCGEICRRCDPGSCCGVGPACPCCCGCCCCCNRGCGCKSCCRGYSSCSPPSCCNPPCCPGLMPKLSKGCCGPLAPLSCSPCTQPTCGSGPTCLPSFNPPPSEFKVVVNACRKEPECPCPCNTCKDGNSNCHISSCYPRPKGCNTGPMDCLTPAEKACKYAAAVTSAYCCQCRNPPSPFCQPDPRTCRKACCTGCQSCCGAIQKPCYPKPIC